jgi:hypothetical protein
MIPRDPLEVLGYLGEMVGDSRGTVTASTPCPDLSSIVCQEVSFEHDPKFPWKPEKREKSD